MFLAFSHLVERRYFDTHAGGRSIHELLQGYSTRGTGPITILEPTPAAIRRGGRNRRSGAVDISLLLVKTKQ